MNNIIDSGFPSIEAWTFSNLTPDTIYYFRVRARNNAGNSTWSGTAAISTDVAPLEAPGVPISPGFVSATETVLMFGVLPPNSGGEVVTYRWELSTSTDFSNPVQTKEQALTLVTFSNLNSNTTYYARVRAQNTAGNSVYTSTVTGTTLVVVLTWGRGEVIHPTG